MVLRVLILILLIPLILLQLRIFQLFIAFILFIILWEPQMCNGLFVQFDLGSKAFLIVIV